MALFAYRAVDAEGRSPPATSTPPTRSTSSCASSAWASTSLTFEGGQALHRGAHAPRLAHRAHHLLLPPLAAAQGGRQHHRGAHGPARHRGQPGLPPGVASLLEDIEGGLKLSEAMANHSYCFDDVFVALVRAGEQSGQLTEVLDELTENLKWQDEIASQAKKAMIYPADRAGGDRRRGLRADDGAGAAARRDLQDARAEAAARNRDPDRPVEVFVKLVVPDARHPGARIGGGWI